MSFTRGRVISIVVALLFVAATCRYGYLIRGGVSSELESRVRARSSQPFQLADIAGFPWDRVVFLGPYDNQEMADRALEFHWRDFSLFGLDHSDGFSLIVFANSGHVARAEKVGRCRPDFAMDLRGIAVSRENATFAIATTSNCPVLTLATGSPHASPTGAAKIGH